MLHLFVFFKLKNIIKESGEYGFDLLTFRPDCKMQIRPKEKVTVFYLITFLPFTM